MPSWELQENQVWLNTGVRFWHRTCSIANLVISETVNSFMSHSLVSPHFSTKLVQLYCPVVSAPSAEPHYPMVHFATARSSSRQK
jgi:hypothetical protein